MMRAKFVACVPQTFRSSNPLNEPVIEARNLSVTYRLGGAFSNRRLALRAVDGVNFMLNAGETLGLVGESGSGKSSVGMAVLRLVDGVEGQLLFKGRDFSELSSRKLNRLRRELQVVFQDPYTSLNPAMTVEQNLAEPLVVHEKFDRHEQRRRIEDILKMVGLPATYAERWPRELSGGQRQRIAIARAMILRPAFIFCDEPVSSLDVSTQGQIINLIEDVQKQFGTSILFAAHDLSVVRHICDRIAVMYLGRIVESGPTERVCEAPGHPYTATLISALPKVGTRRVSRVVLKGERPSPLNPPVGCHFQTRCPLVMPICRRDEPIGHKMIGGGSVACHLHTHGPNIVGASVWPLLEPSRGNASNMANQNLIAKGES
jgi:peptide/nickel transport system ATP-binding protein